MEAGSLRKAGEAGAGDGISKGGESREKWEIFRNIGTIFRNRKSTQRRELLRKGAKTESAGCGWQEVQTLLSPPPPTPPPPQYDASEQFSLHPDADFRGCYTDVLGCSTQYNYDYKRNTV